MTYQTLTEYELTPEFDSRKSFYGKARVRRNDYRAELVSYTTKVAEVNLSTYEVELFPAWDSSATTLRHVKEFLKQYGFTADTKAQIERDYA